MERFFCTSDNLLARNSSMRSIAVIHAQSALSIAIEAAIPNAV